MDNVMDNVSPNIAIVTDSSSDLPEELARENDITVIPMYIGIEGKAYKEGKDITTSEVFRALEDGKRVNTSGPSVGDFVEVFKYLIEEKKKDIIYYIGLSARLSSTLNAAILASKYFPNTRIKIFDSKTSTISMGFIALEAARAAKRGKSEEEIDALINFLIKRNRFFAVLNNFVYVFRGGRALFLGKFLSAAVKFKPILTIGSNGKVHLKKFVRTQKNGIMGIYRLIKNEILPGEKSKIGIFYGGDIKPALELKKMITKDKNIDIDELIVTEITTIIGAHTGPGIWGAAFSPKIEDDTLFCNY